MSKRVEKGTVKRKRGLGRLYKRDEIGTEYPATSRTRGAFWLEYRIGGVRKRQLLRDPAGNPITTLRDAEQERARIVAPYMAADKVEAIETLKEKLQAAQGELTEAEDEAAPAYPLASAWESFMDSPARPDAGPETLARYKGHFENFTAWLGKEHQECKRLRDVTPIIAGRYATHLARQSFSGSTFNKHLDFLKLFFRTMTKPARLKGNPFGDIERKRQKPQSRRELTLEELKTLLERAEGELALLLYIGTFTGLRWGDCCTLRWAEVDLHRQLIRRIPNKTASTQAKPVVIGIPPVLHTVLNKATRRGEYVMPGIAARYKDASTLRPELSREIQAHFAKCGIRTHKEGTGGDTKKRAVVEVGFHSLRHTYVTMHAERGTPAAVIQGNVGHSNPAMTRLYTHISDDSARAVSLSLPAITQADDKAKPILSDSEKLKRIGELTSAMTPKNWKATRKAIARTLKGTS